MMRTLTLLVLLVLPGAAAVALCGSPLLRDGTALNAAYARFERLAGSSADLRALFVVHAVQDDHGFNSFAEGVGVLLGAILVVIGLHGICTLRGNHGVRHVEGQHWMLWDGQCGF